MQCRSEIITQISLESRAYILYIIQDSDRKDEWLSLARRNRSESHSDVMHQTEQVLKVIWEERVAKASLVTMGRPKFTPKTAPSLLMITNPSNTPIPQPTPLTAPNVIRIQSVVLPQFTFVDRQMGHANVLYH